MSTIVITAKTNCVTYQRDGGKPKYLFGKPTTLVPAGTDILFECDTRILNFLVSDTITIGSTSYTGAADTAICDAIEVLFRKAGGTASTTSNAVSFEKVVDFYKVGDSYAQGYPQGMGRGMMELFSAKFLIPFTDLSTGGVGVGSMALNVNSTVPVTGSTKAILCHIGLNDVRQTPNIAKCVEKIKSGMKSILANLLFQNFTHGFNMTTKVGSWTAVNLTTGKGGKSGQFGGVVGAQTNVNGDYLEKVFAGDGIMVGFINVSTANAGLTAYQGGVFDISVDGVVKKTVTTDAHDGFAAGFSADYSPGTVILRGLGAGNHTIRITNKSGQYVMIDYVSEMRSAATTQPALISLISKLSTTGYAGTGLSLATGTDYSNQGDAAIQSAVNEFSGYPFVTVPINNYIDPTDALQRNADNIHLTDLGYYNASKAFINAAICTLVPTTATQKTAAYTATAQDITLLGDATTAAFTFTLPDGKTVPLKEYTIEKIDSSANAVTIACTGGQLINGAATYNLTAQYKYVRVKNIGATTYNGTPAWIIVGSN